MVMYFSPNCVVKNPDIVGGIVEVEACSQVSKVSWVCIHSNDLEQCKRFLNKSPRVSKNSYLLSTLIDERNAHCGPLP